MIKLGDKVTIAFQLKDESGKVWDEYTREQPFTYIQGKHQMMSFIEDALLGKAVNTKCQIQVTPEQGYGVRDEKLVSTLSREHFQGIDSLKKGMRFNPSLDPNISFEVIDFDDHTVTVDANHPLAGKQLLFDIEVLAIESGA